MALKKVKFLQNVPRGNKKVDKKGSTRLVTGRHAAFLEANKLASIVEEKENKAAAARETK